MKGFVIALSIIIALSACKKSGGVSSVPAGNVDMELNGKPWSGTVSWMNSDTGFSFSVTKFQQFGNEWMPAQDLHIRNVKQTLSRQLLFKDDFQGTYPATFTFAYFFTSDNGHAGCDNYAVLPSDTLNNWIEITEETNNYSEISGKFNVTFYRVDGCAVSTLPDTLRITNGHFHLY